MFDELNLRFLKQKSSNEYSSECPRCGGSVHSNGEFPDRFIILVKSKTTGGIFGWCRKCNFHWAPSVTLFSSVSNSTITPETKLDPYPDILKDFQFRQKWIQYHNNLDAEKRKFYYSRNISDYWINYWMLGYNPEKFMWDGKNEWSTPAHTIPIFIPGGECVNIRNRLMNPVDSADKYRPEQKGLKSSLFLTNFDSAVGNKVLIVEGEYKAMTTFLTIDDPNLYVVGIPGKTPKLEMLDSLGSADVIYLMLDPDAYSTSHGVNPVDRIAKYFPGKTRKILLPYKVDDMIVNNWINKYQLRNVIDNAVK